MQVQADDISQLYKFDQIDTSLAGLDVGNEWLVLTKLRSELRLGQSRFLACLCDPLDEQELSRTADCLGH